MTSLDPRFAETNYPDHEPCSSTRTTLPSSKRQYHIAFSSVPGLFVALSKDTSGITVAIMRTALVFLLIVCILCGNFILFYFLGIPKLFRELVQNHQKKQKISTKQEWIEMQSDVQQRAKERRRKEEKQRWERNAARKRSGFYAELEQAYNKA